MVLEDRIMNVSAALDSFDHHRRGTGKSVNFAKRIKACVDLAGQPFLDLIVVDAAHWTQRVVDTRNDLAHHRESFRATGGAGDHILAEQLFWLFAMCTLRLTDAPPEVFERITQHRRRRPAWSTAAFSMPHRDLSDGLTRLMVGRLRHWPGLTGPGWCAVSRIEVPNAQGPAEPPGGWCGV